MVPKYADYKNKTNEVGNLILKQVSSEQDSKIVDKYMNSLFEKYLLEGEKPCFLYNFSRIHCLVDLLTVYLLHD